MSKNILISGGTGLVGSRLSQLLIEKGYKVSYLSRHKENIPSIKVYQWDIAKNYIETGAIEEADCIINLAGAGVADEMWTEPRKKVILESRTLSTRLLGEKLKTVPNRVNCLINASAIGIYGLDTGNTLLIEDAPKGNDFLAKVVVDWEKEADKINQSLSGKLRVVKLRIGVVLSNKGGALEKLSLPVKLFVGAAIGSGKQYISWIHVDDLCQQFIKAIEDPTMQGAYNAVAPHPVTNKELTKAIGKALHRPVILPNVPAFVLKMGMGEMANIVLGGNKVSAQKIEQAGFKFKFRTIEEALKDLLA